MSSDAHGLNVPIALLASIDVGKAYHVILRALGLTSRTGRSGQSAWGRERKFLPLHH